MEAIKKELEVLKGHLDSKIEEANSAVEKSITGKLDEKLKTEVKTLSDLVTKKEEALTKMIDKLDAQVQKGMISGKDVQKSFEQMLSEGFSADGIIEKYREQNAGAFELEGMTGNALSKAVGTMTEAASLTGEVIAPTRRESIVELAQRPTHVRALLAQGTMTSNTFRFIQETAGEGAVDMTGEGLAKNQVDYDLEAIDAPVRKITGFARISEEMLEDIPALSGFLSRRLTKDIRKKEDQQLLYGTGSGNQLTGLSVNASTFAAYYSDTNAQIIDLIIAVYASLENLNYEASGVLLSPRDYYLIYTAKDADGGYVKQDLVTTIGGQLFIAGIPVFRNTAVATGEYFIGDWLNGAQLFDRAGITIKFSEEDGDNFTKNLVTVRAEERLAFPVYHPDSFFHGVVDTDVTKIKNFT